MALFYPFDGHCLDDGIPVTGPSIFTKRGMVRLRSGPFLQPWISHLEFWSSTKWLESQYCKWSHSHPFPNALILEILGLGRIWRFPESWRYPPYHHPFQDGSFTCKPSSFGSPHGHGNPHFWRWKIIQDPKMIGIRLRHPGCRLQKRR